MKLRIILATLVLGCSIALAETADQHYQNGMNAITRGDAVAAQTSFTEALKIQPNHANARYQLHQLPSRKKDMLARTRSKQLATVILPSIDFKNVALSDALMALNQMVETESTKTNKDAPFNPNLMIQDSSGKLGEREITLRLKQVPAKTALNYILEQVGATVRYDEHATIVRPAHSTPTADKAPK